MGAIAGEGRGPLIFPVVQMNKAKVLCVSKELIPSPKAEDNVIRYAFRQVGGLNQKAGEMILDAVIMFYLAPNNQFEVGKEYSFEGLVNG